MTSKMPIRLTRLHDGVKLCGLSVRPASSTTSPPRWGPSVPDRAALTQELRSLILNDLVPLDDDELRNDSSLVDAVLDSLGIAEVASFIESHIGRPLSADEEVRATFASIDTVIEFIARNS